MTESIKFIDKTLDAVVQQSVFKFSRFQKYLEETSTDLKNLEKWLQNCAICLPVLIQTDDPDIKVGWDNDSGTWRLVGEFTVEDQQGEYREKRPIIEMPIRVRLLCRKFLPEVVQELSKLLPDEGSNDKPYSDLDVFNEPDPPPSKKPVKAAVKAKPAGDTDDLDAIFASDDEIPF